MNGLTNKQLVSCARQARDNMARWISEGKPEIEQQARAAARWADKDEEEWPEFISLLEALEDARLRAIALSNNNMTPEQKASYANYMANR